MTFSILPPLALATAANPAQAIDRTTDYTPQVKSNSVFGATGLINIPTAFTTDRDSASFGFSADEDLRGLTGSVGLVGNVEVGASFLERSDDPDRGIAHAKLHVVPENVKWLEVGVGVIDPFDAINTTGFVVGSASVVPPRGGINSAFGMRVHVGLGSGLYSERMFYGAEVWFREHASIIGEWDTRKFNAAFRYHPGSDLSFIAGIANKGPFFSANVTVRY